MTKKDIWSADFEVKNNLLYYRPGGNTEWNIDHALKVEGNWNITKNGRLQFLVKHTQNDTFGKTIAVGTALRRADSSCLEFKAARRISVKGVPADSVVLSGTWAALPGKNISFLAAREDGADTLKVEGSWQVLPRNQIGCFIKRTAEGKKITDLIVLKGDWQIAGNRLTYKIENSTQPFFTREFSVSRAVFSDKENKLELILGAEVKNKTTSRGSRDSFSLTGTWKQEGLKAEFTFTAAKRQTITFTLSRKFSNDKELVFQLDTGRGQKPAFTITLNKKIKDDSSFFIRAKAGAKEKRVEAGFYFPF